MILKSWLIFVPICIFYIMMGQSTLKTSTSYKQSTRYQPLGIGAIEDDMCAYLNGTGTGVLLRLVGPIILHVSNLKHRKCPMTGEMYVKNFIPSFDGFPTYFLPSGQWRAEVLLFTKAYNKRIELLLGHFFVDVYPNRRFRKGGNHTFLED